LIRSYIPTVVSIIIIQVLTTQILYAQKNTNFKIIGQVTDITTSEPLHFANVFLSGTTIGSASNKNGQYEIHQILPGHYEIVVTMIGYESEVRQLHIFKIEDIIHNFKLKPKVLEGERISITAKYPKKWKKNLNIFKRVFFGVNQFANECELQNPEVLEFEYNKATGHFMAFSPKPIGFINNALGYKVTFYILAFTAQLYNDNIYSIISDSPNMVRLRKGTLNYAGTIQYEELVPQNDKERKKWIGNRLSAYHGSQRHFNKSLIDGRLEVEGFKIRGAKRRDSDYEYDVTPDTLLTPSQNKHEKNLHLTDYLKVTYTKEKDIVRYQIDCEQLDHFNIRDIDVYERRLSILEDRWKHQISWIKIRNDKNVTLSLQGSIIPGHGIIQLSGYWSWDSPAEWLPTDYYPVMKSIK